MASERETVDIESRCIYGEAVEHRSGGFVYDFHDVLKRLESVCWHETMFADMQTYYAEEGVYVMRCKHGTPNAHYCIIRAKSLDEAISRAVFDLHKANESREEALLRKELKHTLEFIKQCEKADMFIALKLIQDPNKVLKAIEEARDELKDHIRAALGEKGNNDGE